MVAKSLAHDEALMNKGFLPGLMNTNFAIHDERSNYLRYLSALTNQKLLTFDALSIELSYCLMAYQYICTMLEVILLSVFGVIKRPLNDPIR